MVAKKTEQQNDVSGRPPKGYKILFGEVKKNVQAKLIHGFEEVEKKYEEVVCKEGALSEFKIELGKLAYDLKEQCRRYCPNKSWGTITEQVFGDKKRRIDETINAFIAVEHGASRELDYSKLVDLGAALTNEKDEHKKGRATGAVKAQAITIVKKTKDGDEDVSIPLEQCSVRELRQYLKGQQDKPKPKPEPEPKSENVGPFQTEADQIKSTLHALNKLKEDFDVEAYDDNDRDVLKVNLKAIHRRSYKIQLAIHEIDSEYDLGLKVKARKPLLSIDASNEDRPN